MKKRAILFFVFLCCLVYFSFAPLGLKGITVREAFAGKAELTQQSEESKEQSKKKTQDSSGNEKKTDKKKKDSKKKPRIKKKGGKKENEKKDGISLKPSKC